MASPVSTAVKHLHNGMGAAMPVWSGTAGAGIAVLDVCLVNGADLKTLTSLVVNAGVATATWTGVHSASPHSVILVAGVTGALAALNGEQKVISKTATTCTFATAAADGTAAGTITIKMAPAGWEKVFSDTNRAVYRSQDVLGTRMYLKVDDTDPQTMRVFGFEEMSGIDVGVGPFPTNTQQVGGGYWHKNPVTNTTPIDWTVIADSRLFYIHTSPYQGNGPSYTAYSAGAVRGFGDMTPLRAAGDPYACVLAYGDTANANFIAQGSFGSTGAQMALPRSYTGLGSGIVGYSKPYSGSWVNSGMDASGGIFPSNIDGTLRLSRRYISESNAGSGNSPRMDVPGIYSVPQAEVDRSFGNRALLAGGVGLQNRTLMALSIGDYAQTLAGGGTSGVLFVDITGGWRS